MLILAPSRADGPRTRAPAPAALLNVPCNLHATEIERLDLHVVVGLVNSLAGWIAHAPTGLRAQCSRLNDHSLERARA